MFDIALFEPQIAPNTGNIIRLAANNGCHLHLIEPFGFKLDAKSVRRAGLDYHDLANVTTYKNYAAFKEQMGERRILACTTKGTRKHSDVAFTENDVLLFGAETHGLHPDVMNSIEPENRIRIPMCDSNRSLNLSNSVAIISYEAWRQLDYVGAST